MAVPNLPPGYRFNPTDQEIINSYLKPKVTRKEHAPAPVNLVKERPLYSAAPWELFDDQTEEWVVSQTAPGKFKKTIYIFTKRQKKAGANGMRSKRRPVGGKEQFVRTAGCGTWDGQTVNKIWNNKGGIIGFKKMFGFETNGASEKMSMGHWIMHEYSLSDVESDYVLCEIERDDSKQLKTKKKPAKSPKIPRIPGFTISKATKIKSMKKQSSRRKGCEHNTHSEHQNLDLPPELVTYMECLSVEESKEFGAIQNNSKNLVQVCTSSSPCLEEFKDFGATIQNNSEKLVPICTGGHPYVEGFEDFGSTIENYSEKLESGCTSSIPYVEGFEEIGATIQNNSENFGQFMSYGGADDDLSKCLPDNFRFDDEFYESQGLFADELQGNLYDIQGEQAAVTSGFQRTFEQELQVGNLYNSLTSGVTKNFVVGDQVYNGVFNEGVCNEYLSEIQESTGQSNFKMNNFQNYIWEDQIQGTALLGKRKYEAGSSQEEQPLHKNSRMFGAENPHAISKIWA